MQQHPVPQNVTSYQFRLVGDMTLKQFLELAAGLALAYIFFISSLVFFLKWPLIIISVLLGIALAFFPLEERPLDQWIINFIKSIYAPTRFIWRKSINPPAIFTFTKKQIREENPTIEKAQKTRAPQPVNIQKEEEMSEVEISRLNQITSLFDQVTSKFIHPSPHPTIPPTNSPIKPAINVKKLEPKPISQSNAEVIFDHTKSTPPQIEKVEEPTPDLPQDKPSEENFTNIPSVTKESVSDVKKAKLMENMPVIDNKPNTVVGIVTNKEGKLMPNAIVELLDEEGIPQRAVKTNPLGQFLTATPLLPGKYIIQVEKDNLTFPQQEIKVTNKVIPPIHLQSN